MVVSKPVITKGVCAAVLSLVVLQLSWAYWSGDALSSLPLHHTQHTSKGALSTVYCHGNANCFPSMRISSNFDVEKGTEFCHEWASDLIEPPPRVATVTAHFGKPQHHYQRALGTHALHNALQGTSVHVLSTKLIDGLWNKVAFLLDLLLVETKKTATERLEWISCVDRDTIILDYCRLPMSFLPEPVQKVNETDVDPAEEIHRLATRDWNGLNNGIFLISVNGWSIDLFTAILAHRYYRPEADLLFTEQSAMGNLLDEPKFHNNVAWVP